MIAEQLPLDVAADPTDLASLKRIVLQAKPYWSRIVTITLLTALSAPLTSLTPVPLMIAHRLSTLSDCKLIMELEAGRPKTMRPLVV